MEGCDADSSIPGCCRTGHELASSLPIQACRFALACFRYVSMLTDKACHSHGNKGMFKSSEKLLPAQLFFCHPKWLLKVFVDGKHRATHSKLLGMVPSRDKHGNRAGGNKLPSREGFPRPTILLVLPCLWLGCRGFMSLGVWILFNVFSPNKCD